jgi:hypothetical protein
VIACQAVRRFAHRVIHRVGRRGAFLLFLTVLDVSYGKALLDTAVAALHHGPHLIFSQSVWGWVWIGVGLVALTGVPARQHDWLQFGVVAALKASWAALFADVWLVQHEPDGWVSLVVWLAFSLTVILVGSWPEHARVEIRPTLPDLGDLGRLGKLQ